MSDNLQRQKAKTSSYTWFKDQEGKPKPYLERSAWRQRPRVHLFDYDAFRCDLRQIELQLHWSNEQLYKFELVVNEYSRNPTIENYLRVRREFPEVEIEIAEFAGVPSLFALREEFENQGIDPRLVAGCLSANEPAIDALCLRLMELLVEREKISKHEPGHIQKRRATISDAMVNYLIVWILESIDSRERDVRIPASLPVLVRHLLTGTKPDLHAAFCRGVELYYLVQRVARSLKPDEKLSINKLASIADIPRIRAARLLKDEEFKELLARTVR